ncbi:DNA alkylation repair protein [Nitrososphaera viennensis]|uniref:DNA alkylation repair enzyme n=2 Tax=Nitrososphaera viennensis TaxID=1034015 RepID=A0A060HMJ8_9ARCH|nr:DNA alkylation repair protein [Nitrososphaera viennensis]AIC16713.1 DNA alkylation repair enzyme [Nitrososphaera viennensis EN76]UVS70650.1 DNA alkylation repair protein [Nitrososphaera viennensis]
MLDLLKGEMQALADQDKAKFLQRFFKTGPGQYGQGDIFMGIMVPASREVARKYAAAGISLADVKALLHSQIHEERLVALLILVQKYQKNPKEGIAQFYLENLAWVNNWDLVDLSAPAILGAFLLDKKEDRSLLYGLARSKVLWERRVSIVSTHAFIRKNDFSDTLKISEMLLGDSHDLIHKAVGWMLREVGKRDPATEEEFLQKHYKKMPRTALRYAIERFSAEKRRSYMQGTA